MNTDFLPSDLTDSIYSSDDITIPADTIDELLKNLNDISHRVNSLKNTASTFGKATNKPSEPDSLDKIILEIEKYIKPAKLESLTKIISVNDFTRVFNKLPDSILDALTEKYY